MAVDFLTQQVTSADNASAVTLSCSAEHRFHTLTVTTTGTVTAGTAGVQMNGQDIGSVSLTAPVPMIIEAHMRELTVTPASLDAGATFTVHLASSL